MTQIVRYLPALVLGIGLGFAGAEGALHWFGVAVAFVAFAWKGEAEYIRGWREKSEQLEPYVERLGAALSRMGVRQ